MNTIVLAEMDPWADPDATFAECDLCGHRQLDDFMTNADHALRPVYQANGGEAVCENCLPDLLGEP